MQRIEIAYDVERAPDEVFAFLTDFAQLRRWRTLESLRVEPAGPVRVGSRLHTTVKGPRKPMWFTNEVTVLDPGGRAYDDRAIDGTFLIESGWLVEPRAGGSRIRWNTRFGLRGPMALLTPVFRRVIRQGQMQDLGQLKGILEGD
ncbi:MAG TPA: SRPBCC family protein [Thermomicrobiales bacterium]|nr:SRPBCC family protein [Thermomicrobiales bacterium]